MPNLDKIWPNFDLFLNSFSNFNHSFEKNEEWTEDNKNFYLKLPVPGHDSKSIKADLNGNVLTISGSSLSEDKTSKFSRCFTYSWNISKNVDCDKIEVKCQNGVVIVTMPKLEQPKSTVRELLVG